VLARTPGWAELARRVAVWQAVLAEAMARVSRLELDFLLALFFVGLLHCSCCDVLFFPTDTRLSLV
jgi:hypothetical protein